MNSYPSIYNLGHKAISELFNGPVIVEEKVDGSQFSFGRGVDGEVRMRSKGAIVNPVAPEGMFARAVIAVNAVADRLPAGLTFRGEYLSKPKHNVLCYERVPTNHIAIFDVNNGEESYLPYAEKAELAKSLGFAVVPLLYDGMVEDPMAIRAFLERESMLGGQKIEGVVIKPKNYDLFGRDKKVLFGKFVSEAFKETHAKEWTAEHKEKSCGDILQILAATLTTQARWTKAIQHLREGGKIEDSPKDIGLVMKEVPEDIKREEEDYIKSKLFEWAWPQIRRSVTHGFPEWYKEQLLKLQFEAK